MPLREGGGGIPDLGRESRPPKLGMAQFSELSLEDQEIGRGELRARRQLRHLNSVRIASLGLSKEDQRRARVLGCPDPGAGWLVRRGGSWWK
jgi:hypothetical protein